MDLGRLEAGLVGVDEEARQAAMLELGVGLDVCFCSSVPQRRIDEQTSEVCTDTTVRIALSPRPTSSTMSP